MAMTTIEKNKILQELDDWFYARVRQHYIELDDKERQKVITEADYVLIPHVSDAMIQNRQYNPVSNKVEEI